MKTKFQCKEEIFFYLLSFCISCKLITCNVLIQQHLMKTSSAPPPMNALPRGKWPVIGLFLLAMVTLCSLIPTATEGAILTLQELRETKFLPPPIKRFEHTCLIKNTINAGRRETQTWVIQQKKASWTQRQPLSPCSLKYTVLHSTGKQRANSELLSTVSPDSVKLNGKCKLSVYN